MDNNTVAKIENIKFNKKKQTITLQGFCFMEGVDIELEEKVKKSIIIANGKKSYVVKAKNIKREDITKKYGCGLRNYDYSGFSCVIDVGFIDGMKPIDDGKWQIEVYLNLAGNEYRGEINLAIKDWNENVESASLTTGDEYELDNKVVFRYGYNKLIFIDKSLDKLILDSKTDFSISVSKEKVRKKIKKMMVKLKKRRKKYMEKFGLALYKVFSLFPVKKNRVSFLTDSRDGLYGNFRLVNDELKNRGISDIKYMLKPHDNMKKTLIEKIKLTWYIATSGIILLDDYYPFFYNIKPRKESKLVQLWHAPGAFKTFGFSRVGKLGWSKNPRAKNHRTYTHAIVSSENIKGQYAEAYAIPEEKIYATGVPRTDVFFDEEYKNKKTMELQEKYPILKNKKVIMFAPTFRGKGRGGYYNFENLDIDKLRASLSDEYVMIMKLHPFISNKPDFEGKYDDFMIDLSHEKEINDLLFISDIMITDYSSVCFEYSLLNRPMIFFAYDMEDYIAKRDFYFPYESFVPGSIVKTTDEIVDIIQNKKFENDKLIQFRNKFFNHFDGKSTERVVNMLLED